MTEYKETLLTKEEYENTQEHPKRVFRVTFLEQRGVIRTHKLFQHKSNVQKILDDPTKSKFKIYRGDAI